MSMPLPSIILASASAGRRELMLNAGYDFRVEVSQIDDDAVPLPADATPQDVALVRARAKARDVAGRLSEGAVIGADTVGGLDGRMIGKPADRDEAVRMLQRLAGREHEIISAMVVINAATEDEAHCVDTVRVRIRVLTPEEIDAYVRRGLSDGKCAAYSLQNSPEGFAVVLGRYSTVVGMPLEDLPALLDRVGVAGN